MTTQPAIHVHGLEGSFKDIQVRPGVTFDVAPGSIFTKHLFAGHGTTDRAVAWVLSA